VETNAVMDVQKASNNKSFISTCK